MVRANDSKKRECGSDIAALGITAKYEIIRLVAALEEIERQRASIMQRLAAAVDLPLPDKQRKQKRQTLSNEQFIAACLEGEKL